MFSKTIKFLILAFFLANFLPISISLADTPLKSLIISNDGLGFIHEKTPYKQIKKELGKSYTFEDKKDYMDGFSAIEVKQNGTTLFNLVYLVDSKIKANSTFDSIDVDNSEIKTKKGIGPGSLISEAEKAYGKVDLDYHWEVEGRELAGFEHAPENLGFITGVAGDAGIYPKDISTTYQTTSRYKKGAKIEYITVQFGR